MCGEDDDGVDEMAYQRYMQGEDSDRHSSGDFHSDMS